MCDVATDNLIDLSIEEVEAEFAATQQNPIANELFTSTNDETILLPQICDFVSPQRRESFENNPFDMVQKLANRLSDPFDMVEHQARHSNCASVEVKEGNLVSLSNDELPICTESSYGSMCENTTATADSEGSKSTLTKKAVDSRKRLLKFSIANSTFNTTTGRTQSSLTHSNESGFSSEDQNNSPLSELFKNIMSQANEHMLMSESPILLVNDDLMSETPPDGQSPSLDTEFEKDLEMHSNCASVEVKEGNLVSLSNDELPICTESSYGSMCENTTATADSEGSKSTLTKKAVDSRKRLLKFSIANSTFNTPTGRTQSSLTHSNESGFSSEDQNNSPLSELFKNIMSQANEHMLMSESPILLVNDDLMSETPPDGQSPSLDTEFEKDLEMLKIPILNMLPSAVKQEIPEQNSEEHIQCDNYHSTNAWPSLEMLRAKLHTQRLENKTNSDITELISSLKSLICDSAVADVGKKERANNLVEMLSKALAENKQQAPKEQEQQEKVLTPPATIKREGTFDLDLHKQPAMPQSMVSSTATFDGDSAEDKAGLQLPEIYAEDEVAPNQLPVSGQQLDVNELVEQLSKLLGQTEQTDHLLSTQNAVSNLNPTVIVVMNTHAPLSSNILENSCQQLQPETTSNSERAAQAFRRRSQSLSLLDNVKILQLPMPVNTLNTLEPTVVRPTELLEKPENFKTPARMLRRNSYSNGTPYTPISSNSTVSRRSHVGTEGLQKTRRLTIEENQTSVKPVRTALMPSRPDLKKKQKTASIMKSAVPMKATIPVKKIAPSFILSPPTPNKNNAAHAQLDSSIHFLTANKMACTSTPMPTMQSLRCSANAYTDSPTPHAASPIKRSSLMKPRYSYLGSTPISKATSTTPANLNRRSINELRTKSPVKTRFSVTGSISKACANLRTTTAKAAQTATSASRMSALLHNKTLSRLRSPSRNNNIAPNVNKENKRP